MTKINQRKIAIIITIVVVLAIALAVSYLALPKRAADAAPDELLGMEKVVVLEGQGAIEDVRQKHIGAVENVEDMAIVLYGPAYHQITLWVTLYSSDDIAANENKKMADAMIRFGGKWKENLEEVTIGGKKVYRTTPNGDFHYFWAEREYVFYVTIPRILQESTNEIITAIKA
ncbi:MAG: hypothetical protein QMC78_05860 [Methanocellales archaeon]|nr:hypothetical protein [Methanocellales archaeon]